MNGNTIAMVELADAVAESAHHNQTRNDGETAYITHPRAVADIAISMYRSTSRPGKLPLDETYIRQVALLHDVIEDTHVTASDLEDQGFCETVIRAVLAITKHPVKGCEDYLTYLKRVKSNEYARLVKLADLAHNMSDLRPGNMLDKYVLARHFLSYEND
jgi:(p)ppGpp synthase/HD superfamily hydrolase